MKANFFFDFIIFKIFFFSNCFSDSSLLGIGKRRNDEKKEHEIGKIKNSCLNNIIIFENTNGDIYLRAKESFIIFGTSSSNNDQRSFYAITCEDTRYIIKKDNIFVPSLIKNISKTENKEIYNGDLSIYKEYNKIIIFLHGTDGSYMEILEINQYENDFELVSPTDFINKEDKVIKGISSLFYLKDERLIFGTVTKYNVSNYNISIYGYEFSFTEGIGLNFNYNYKYKIEYDDIKGEYLSCFVFNEDKNHISCFYLNKDNNYTIILVQTILNSNDQIRAFYNQKSIIVGSLSDPSDVNCYFLKAISFDSNNCIYMYYSGESNDVPTFLFKAINKTNFELSDTYINFPVIYLNEKYEFNNGIKYNDISFSDRDRIYFVSCSKNKETIIVAYLYLYSLSNNGPKNKLVIRYYTFELKKYYNMKIFHGFKTEILNPVRDRYLSLGFDFCYLDNSSNLDEAISNAGFIVFSYPNISLDKNFDFIYYAFNNNTNYIIVDFMEDSKLENNIFGYFLIQSLFKIMCIKELNIF